MEESRRALLFQKVCHILNIILKVDVMVIIAFPFYWMVSTSLKDYTEALQFPPTLFPSSLHWENYAHVFEIVPIGLYLRNSIKLRSLFGLRICGLKPFMLMDLRRLVS